MCIFDSNNKIKLYTYNCNQNQMNSLQNIDYFNYIKSINGISKEFDIKKDILLIDYEKNKYNYKIYEFLFNKVILIDIYLFLIEFISEDFVGDDDANKKFIISKLNSILLIYNKKIKRFIPKKPCSPFAAFIQFNKGLPVPKGYNTLKYMSFLFNNLSLNDKKKFEIKYSQLVENYNKKIISLNNKIFDLPKKPKSSFAFYLSEKLEFLYKNEKDFDINRVIKMIFQEWLNGKVDKSAYLEKAKKDKIRFEIQLKEFESLGCYSKYYEEDTIV